MHHPYFDWNAFWSGFIVGGCALAFVLCNVLRGIRR